MQWASDLTYVLGHEREWVALDIKRIYFGSWVIHLMERLFPNAKLT